MSTLRLHPARSTPKLHDVVVCGGAGALERNEREGERGRREGERTNLADTTFTPNEDPLQGALVENVAERRVHSGEFVVMKSKQ